MTSRPAGIVGGGGDDLLAEIVVDPVRHRRAELVGRDRGAEQIGIAIPGDGVGAGAGDDVERLLLLGVVEHRERDIAGLHADDHVDLVAFDQLLGLLQPDLRIELVVLLDDLDLAAADGPADAVEEQVHAVEIVLGGIGDRAGEGIEVAELDRRAGLRQQPGAARLDASAAPAPAVPAMNLRRDIRRAIALDFVIVSSLAAALRGAAALFMRAV
jgi:hypothetical protein